MCDAQYTLLPSGFYRVGNNSDVRGNAFTGGKSCTKKDHIIPRTHNGKEIREIGKYALNDVSLTSLVILAPITKICTYGVRNMPLTELILPPTRKIIEDCGVYHFPKMEMIILPKGFKPTSVHQYFLGAIQSSNCTIKYCGYESFSSLTYFSIFLCIQRPSSG